MVEEISKIIGKIVGKDVDFSVTVSEKPEFGHYSTNVAFLVGKDPNEIAEALRRAQGKQQLFKKVEVKGKFINFWIAKDYLCKKLEEVISSKFQVPSSKFKVNVEFISANPTGPITLGNARGAFLGNVLSNVLEMAGHKVVREYYVNDAKVGNQIKELGKAVLGEGDSYKSEYLDEKVKSQKSKVQKLKTPEEAGHFIAQEIQKDNKKFLEKELGIKFNVWFSEESLYKKKLTDKILEILKKRDLVYEKDGALWFKTEKFGDNEDRVLVRSGGEPTYFFSDLAYHYDKFFIRKFDKAIVLWGADHHGYAPRLKAAIKALEIDPERLEIIITQLVRLMKDGREVKISKRAGVFVLLEDLIKEIGRDAATFFFLMNTPDTHMDFDLELAKERSMKNPVYYVQYALVRCKGILQKSKRKTQNAKLHLKNLQKLNSESELNLTRELVKLPDMIWQTAEDYQVSRLARYAMDIARAFHNFYEKERVIGEAGEIMKARLALVSAAKTILEKLFNILGITALEKM